MAPIQNSTTTPLQLDHPSDVLTLLRVLYGRIPEDSLVLIGLREGTTTNCLRVDASTSLDDEAQRSRQYANWCAGGEGPRPDGVLGILITDSSCDPLPAPASPETADRYSGLIAAVQEQLREQHDTEFLQIWRVSDGWMRPFDGLRCGSLGKGYPVSSLLEEGAVRHPALKHVSGGHDPAETLMDFFADPATFSAEQAALITEAAAEPEDATGTDPFKEDTLAQLRLWEYAFAQVQHRGVAAWCAAEPKLAGQLLHGFSTRSLPTALLVSASSGLESAAAGTLRLYLSAADLERLPQADDVAAALTQSGILEADAYTADFLMDTFTRSLQGTTGTRPQWERLECFEDILRTLRPYASSSQLANLWMAKVWIEWVRGRGRPSAAFLSMARSEFPNSAALDWVDELTSRSLCPWAAHPGRAWRSAAEDPQR